MKKLLLTVFVVSIFGITSVPNANADGYSHCYEARTQCLRSCGGGNEQCSVSCFNQHDRCIKAASRRLHSGKKKGGREK
jgi:hypothetical protein